MSDESIVLISQVCVILRNMIVDMWERGEVRTEVDEGCESVDVVWEFAGDILGVLETADSDDGDASDSGGAASTQAPLQELLERSCVVMCEKRHVQLQVELTRHLW